MSYTAHVDTFARDNLPPRHLWPELVFDLPQLRYPDRMNSATVLLDRAIERGWGARRAIVAPGGPVWTYADLLGHANRIARVLVEDLGLVPGNRVLLRAPNKMRRVLVRVMKAAPYGTCAPARQATDIIEGDLHALCDGRLIDGSAARPPSDTEDDALFRTGSLTHFLTWRRSRATSSW
jgi:2-aminobenzoate-CoA ligase